MCEYAAAKAQFQLAQERGMSQAMFDLDLKGKDWNGQLKYGTSNFYGGWAGGRAGGWWVRGGVGECGRGCRCGRSCFAWRPK